jgi:hypothetical protein
MKSWNLLEQMTSKSADNHNSEYVAMHLDRLSDELLAETYGKREELQKKKQKIEFYTESNSSDHEKIKL